MIFKNLLRPISDETYSSWVTRCALNPRIRSISEQNIFFLGSFDYEVKGGIIKLHPLGAEFDFSKSGEMQLANKMKLDVRVLENYFKPSSAILLSQEYRFAYCHLCIQTDVAFKRYPSWRKSWCYVTHPYCSIHRCLLSYINKSNPLKKQWDAYANGASGDYIEGRTRGYPRRSHGIPPGDVRAWLTLRVQLWIERLNNSARYGLPGTDMMIDSSKLRYAVDLILRLFLVPRTPRTEPGIARRLFTLADSCIVHRVIGFNERFEYSAANSVPYERMSALLLLGLVFGIFSPKETAMFNELVTKSDFRLPDLRELGTRAASHVYGDEYFALVKHFHDDDELIIYSREFLEGIFSQYA